MKIFNNPDFKSCDDIDLLLSLKNQNLANYLDAFVNEANKLCLIVEYCEVKKTCKHLILVTFNNYQNKRTKIWRIESTKPSEQARNSQITKSLYGR